MSQVHAYSIVVIDPQGNNLGLQDAFEEHPEYNALHATSLEEAVPHFENNTIYGILIEWEAVRHTAQWIVELQSHVSHENVPVLVVSDAMSPAERVEVFYQGATELFLRPFEAEELFFRLSIHLVKQFLEEGRQKSLSKAQSFARFYAELNSLDSKVLCEKMLDFANNKLHISRVSIWWHDAQEKELVLGLHSYPEFPIDRVPYKEDNMMWKALNQREHILFDSPLSKFDTHTTDFDRAGMAMIVPLIADETVLGVINFTNFSPEFFKHYELDDLLPLSANVVSRLGYALNHEKVAAQEKQLGESNQKLESLNGELQELLEIQQDISKNLLKTSQELADSKRQLEELNQMKDDFLAIASHDLRSPLSGIQLAVETILTCYDVEEDLREMLEPVLGICEEQLVLVSELLDVAKMESGQMDIEYTELSSKEFIKQLQQMQTHYSVLARGKGDCSPSGGRKNTPSGDARFV